MIISSCGEHNEADAIDGLYVDEFKSSCLIISEYEDGKLGYDVYDIANGIDDIAYSFAFGSISISVENNDSIITFTENGNKRKKDSALPIVNGLKVKIKNSHEFIDLYYIKDDFVIRFERMKESKEIKEIKKATKLMLKAQMGKQ